MGIAEHYTKSGALLSMGPCVIAQLTSPGSNPELDWEHQAKSKLDLI